jgi:predicted nucleotidyltransferase
VNRERATRLIEELLERVVAGGERHLDLVDQVSIFGSYARGATEPGDVDVAVEIGRDDTSGHELARAFAEGKDWRAPYRKALRGRRRGYEFAFDQTQRLHDEGFNPVLLWRKGTSLQVALERLHALETDPTLSPTKRDAMLPEFDGLEKHLPLPVRRPLAELMDIGAIHVERLVLTRQAVRNPGARRLIDIRTPKPGVARRVREEGLAWFEQQTINPLTVAIGDRPLRRNQPVKHQLSWTLPRLNHLPGWFRADPERGIWLAIMNPTARAPLTALQITLADEQQLSGWHYLVN